MSAPPFSVKGVVIHQRRVLLLLNERGEWDLPGGRPDPGEDHRAALEREVREETGLSIDVGAALDEHLFEVLPGRFVRILPFVCLFSGGGEVVLSHEHLATRWLPLDALNRGLIEGYPLPAVYAKAIETALRNEKDPRAAGRSRRP